MQSHPYAHICKYSTLAQHGDTLTHSERDRGGMSPLQLSDTPVPQDPASVVV